MTERVAIVTGAARGIGAAIALRLAASGVAVGVIDLDEADDRGDASTPSRSAGGRALGVGADVADADAVAAAVERVATELGAPTILVNNAGILRDNLLFKMSDDDWDAVIGVHLRGAFLMSRAVQAHQVAEKWGRIVNLSSTSALGNRGQANYAAAKAGLQGFTKTLAIELGPFGVTVNAIAPGIIATDMLRGDGRAHRRRLRRLPRRLPRKDVPARRAGHARRHRGRCRVLLLGRGVVRQRPGALRRGRPHGVTAERPRAGSAIRRRARHRSRMPPSPSPPRATRSSRRSVAARSPLVQEQRPQPAGRERQPERDHHQEVQHVHEHRRAE